MVAKPVRHRPQAARQRAECAQGDPRRFAVRLADTYRRGDLHLVNIDAGRPGADDVHVVGRRVVHVFRVAGHRYLLDCGSGPARLGACPPSGGVALLRVHGRWPGTIRGSMSGAQRQFEDGDGMPPPIERCDDRPASATSGCHAMRPRGRRMPADPSWPCRQPASPGRAAPGDVLPCRAWIFRRSWSVSTRPGCGRRTGPSAKCWASGRRVVPRLLGTRRPEASWVVNGTTGEPTGLRARGSRSATARHARHSHRR